MVRPTDIPSLYQYLQQHPRVEQRHYDLDYGMRVLVFYGVNPFTGVFQFWVEGAPSGTDVCLSFGTADSYSFSDAGLAVSYRSGRVEYKYLPNSSS